MKKSIKKTFHPHRDEKRTFRGTTRFDAKNSTHFFRYADFLLMFRYILSVLSAGLRTNLLFFISTCVLQSELQRRSSEISFQPMTDSL